MAGLNFGLGLGLAAPPKGGGFSLPFGSSLVVAGDSITANGYSTTSTLAQILIQAFDNWMLMFSNQPLRLIQGTNAGIGGNTSTQLRARYATDVIAKSPQVVRILIGTNDLTTIPAATTIDNIQYMLDQNAAIGAKTILIKVLPRGSVGAPMNGTQLTAWTAINAWIATKGSSTVKVLDLEAAVGAMDANHTMIPAMSDDAIPLHPNQLGAYALGKAEAAALAGVFSSGSILDATNNAAGNLASNGFFTGTAGSVTSATGQAADSWIGNGSTTGGGTVVYSKVARSGSVGEWQQIAVSGTYTGAARIARLTRTLTGLSLAAGDIIQFVCEVEADAGQVGVVAFTADVTTAADKMNVNKDYLSMTATSEAWTGVMQSIPFALSASSTTLGIEIGMVLKTTAGTDPVSGTMRVGRFAVRKLN